jgi:hypothetical protein
MVKLPKKLENKVFQKAMNTMVDKSIEWREEIVNAGTKILEILDGLRDKAAEDKIMTHFNKFGELFKKKKKPENLDPIKV